jgi:hypothetical protein
MSRGRNKRYYCMGEKKLAVLKRHLLECEGVSATWEELRFHPTQFYGIGLQTPIP